MQVTSTRGNKAVAILKKGYAMVKTISIDTETIGLDRERDEILTLSICDEQGKVLFDGMFKPSHVESWREAAAVNGITPEMVAGCPPISESVEEVQSIVNGADAIVIYNASFDVGFLRKTGIEVPEERVVDAMLLFAEAYGEWDPEHQGYRWKSLSFAADYIGHRWTGRKHGSLADARAALEVAQWAGSKLAVEMASAEADARTRPH